MDDSISLSFLLQDIIHPLKEKYVIYKSAENKKTNISGAFSPSSWITAHSLQLDLKKKII